MKLCVEKLDLLMAQRAMTAGDLSKRSGVSRQSISTIRTRGTCAVKTALKLASGLSVDVADIVKMGE